MAQGKLWTSQLCSSIAAEIRKVLNEDYGDTDDSIPVYDFDAQPGDDGVVWAFVDEDPAGDGSQGPLLNFWYCAPAGENETRYDQGLTHMQDLVTVRGRIAAAICHEDNDGNPDVASFQRAHDRIHAFYDQRDLMKSHFAQLSQGGIGAPSAGDPNVIDGTHAAIFDLTQVTGTFGGELFGTVLCEYWEATYLVQVKNRDLRIP